MDSLRNPNIILADWCCMIKNSEEFVDHILLHSPLLGCALMSNFFLVGEKGTTEILRTDSR